MTITTVLPLRDARSLRLIYLPAFEAAVPSAFRFTVFSKRRVPVPVPSVVMLLIKGYCSGCEKAVATLP